MEKKGYVIAIVLVLLIIVCSFIPFNNKREIIIKAQLYDVAKQLNDLHNWKQWNTDLKSDNIKITGNYNADQSAIINEKQSYTLHHINPINVSFTRKFNYTSVLSFISLSPTTDDSSTNVIWSEDVTIFEIIKRNITQVNSRQTNLENLKKLLEDVNHKYGFFIHIIPVKDTMILTAEATSADKMSNHIVPVLYKSLQLFIKKNNLPSETKYFYKTVLNNNNKIAVGIPVYKKLSDSDNIKFLKLPGNGRLVEGNYSGNLSNKQSIYTSLNSFMLDQHLKQVAQPFEQYNIADTILQSNSDINIKIYYPVF